MHFGRRKHDHEYEDIELRRGLDRVMDPVVDSTHKDYDRAITRLEHDLYSIKGRLDDIDMDLHDNSRQLEDISDKVTKVDGRLWTIIILVVGSIALPLLVKAFGD